jgi:cell wall-associated NlpC family hydrolase
VNGRRRFIVPLFFATLLSLLVFTASASATPLSQQIRDLQKKANTLYMQEGYAVDAYNSANDQYTTVMKAIAENTKLLGYAQFNLTIADSNLKKRLVLLYKEQQVQLLDVLLSTSSFDALVTQLDTMKQLNAGDVATVKTIKKLRQEIRDRGVKLAADKKAATTLLAQKKDKLAAIKAIESKVNRLIAGKKNQLRRLEAQQAAAARARAVASQLNPLPNIDPGSAGGGRSQVVAIAQRYLGLPYVYGASGPSSFDCSGLTMFVYAQIGISLPHNAAAQQPMGTSFTDPSQAAPGDLVFFGYPAYHVGIYVGGGSMIHAPHTGTVVQYGSIAGASSFSRF